MYIQIILCSFLFELLNGFKIVSASNSASSFKRNSGITPRIEVVSQDNFYKNDDGMQGTNIRRTITKYITNGDEIQDELEAFFSPNLSRRKAPALIKIYYFDDGNHHKNTKRRIHEIIIKRNGRIPINHSDMFKDAKVDFITDEINLEKDDNKHGSENSLRHPRRKRKHHKKLSYLDKLSGRKDIGSSLNDEHIYNKFRINELRSKLYGKNLSLSDKLWLEDQIKLRERVENMYSIKKKKTTTASLKKRGRITTRTKFRFTIG